MRSVTSTVLNAIRNEKSAKMLIQAEIQPSRCYFSTLYEDHPYDGENYALPTDTPVGQAACVGPNGMVTFIVDDDGDIIAMRQGYDTTNDIGLNADPETKVAAYAIGTGSAYLWYWTSGNGLRRSTINLTSLAVSNTINITIDYIPPQWSISKLSPHALDADHFAVTYLTDKGGISCAYFDGTDWNQWGLRFMSPNKAMNGRWTIYSTAAILGDRIFFYLTDMDTGEVKGVYCNVFLQQWSDSFTALPADLSRFCIANAVTAGGYVHLAGQFHRTDDLAAAKVYSLVVRSSDGINFSWDLFSLLSKLGYRFHIALDAANDYLYASDRNSVGRANLSYFFTTTPGTTLTLGPPRDIISFECSSSSATLRLRAYDEELIDHAIVAKKNRIKLRIGYNTSLGTEYTHYSNYIIDGVHPGFADGVRQLQLDLVVEGLWKTSQITFPFYAEITSKSAMYDDCDELDHTYTAPGQAKRQDTMVIDLWNNTGWDGEGCTAYSMRTKSGPGCENQHNTGPYTIGWRTQDLKDKLAGDSYPEIVGTTLTIKLYGWMRTESGSYSNDEITIYITTIDTDGVETNRVGSLSSTYNKWPQEYPDSEAGSNPIIYTWSGLTAGDHIKWIAVKQVNAGGTTWWNPARFEVTGVEYPVSGLDGALTWKQTKPDDYASAAKTMLEVPGWGLPYIVFAQKPYTAFRFSSAAQFVYRPGTSPLSPGTIGFGVVGLAEDGGNYIAARYNIKRSRAELVYARNSRETLIAYWDVTGLSGDLDRIMLEHRDGLLTVRCLGENDTGWSPAVIAYHWDESANGVMSTSDTGIMHVGAYGIIDPPDFPICSLSILDADGIAILPGTDMTEFEAFPASGSVLIDGIKYTYGSKTAIARWDGPWQGRQSDDYADGAGAEIAHYHPGGGANDYAGYLLAIETGHTWEIESTDWTVVHDDPLRNRCRHYTDSMNGDNVGANWRCWEAPGLTDLELGDDALQSYFHPVGSRCFIYGTDRIWLKNLTTSSQDHDATVKDMVKQLCAVASVETDFSGDWTADVVNVSGTPTQLATTQELFPGGYDIRFILPTLTGGSWLALYASNLYIGDENSTEPIEVGFKGVGDNIQVYWKPKDGTYGDGLAITSACKNYLVHNVRVLFHAEFISFYIDDISIATFSLIKDDLHWPETQLAVYAYASASKMMLDVNISELFDWREAIYVESEMSASSAIGSVIQERPVEVNPTTGGGLSFSYRSKRDTIAYTNDESHRILQRHFSHDSTTQDAGSDAVVYYAEVGFVSDDTFADNEGFLTRVLKLSTLDTGAVNAARILLEKANERQYTHDLSMRPDIRIETGDRIELHYLLSGTATQKDHNMIVEDYSIGIREGELLMQISARRDL